MEYFLQEGYTLRRYLEDILQEGGQILLIAFSCATDSDWPDDITEAKRLKVLTNFQILAEGV